MVVAKLTYPVSNNCDSVIAQLPPFVKFMTKHNSNMVKGIDNAFDHMELCFVLSAEELLQWQLACFSKKLLPSQKS